MKRRVGAGGAETETRTVRAKKDKATFDAEAAKSMSAEEIGAWLDERERRFAAAYNRTLNGTQAAIEAGYRPGKNNASAAVQASRLLREERVRLYRAALIRQSMDDQVLTRENIVLKLLEIYQRCMQAEPVLIYDSAKREYIESGVWQFDSKGATRALGQLSKILGYDAPVKLEGGDQPVRIELEGETAAFGQ